MEPLKLSLVLQNHSLSGLAVTPAPVADLTEAEVQVSARHTDPVADTLCILLLRSLLLLKLLLLLRGKGWDERNRSARLELRLQCLSRDRLRAGVLFDARGGFRSVRPNVSLLFHLLLALSTALLSLLPKQMVRLAVQILLGLLLLATVALLPSKEVVVLAAAADPTAIGKVKFVLATGVLLLGFGGIFGCANLFSFNFNKIDLFGRSHFWRYERLCRRAFAGGVHVERGVFQVGLHLLCAHFEVRDGVIDSVRQTLIRCSFIQNLDKIRAD